MSYMRDAWLLFIIYMLIGTLSLYVSTTRTSNIPSLDLCHLENHSTSLHASWQADKSSGTYMYYLRTYRLSNRLLCLYDVYMMCLPYNSADNSAILADVRSFDELMIPDVRSLDTIETVSWWLYSAKGVLLLAHSFLRVYDLNTACKAFLLRYLMDLPKHTALRITLVRLWLSLKRTTCWLNDSRDNRLTMYEPRIAMYLRIKRLVWSLYVPCHLCY
jgi:hypothetical protein